jgi:hypothetical protein
MYIMNVNKYMTFNKLCFVIESLDFSFHVAHHHHPHYPRSCSVDCCTLPIYRSIIIKVIKVLKINFCSQTYGTFFAAAAIKAINLKSFIDSVFGLSYRASIKQLNFIREVFSSVFRSQAFFQWNFFLIKQRRQ